MYMDRKSHEIVSYFDQLTLYKLISCPSRSDVENWKNKVNGRLEDTKSRPGRVTRDTWSRYDVCEQFVADYGKLRGNKNRYLRHEQRSSTRRDATLRIFFACTNAVAKSVRSQKLWRKFHRHVEHAWTELQVWIAVGVNHATKVRRVASEMMHYRRYRRY